MSESKTAIELTEPGDRTEAMMYWHERAMKAESERESEKVANLKAREALLGRKA